MRCLKTVGRCLCAALLLAVSGCAPTGTNSPKAVDMSGLKLTRAVLYQNGVGYFERRGTVDGDQFTVRIRADQVNDFLKSLTVIDLSNGKAVSVSLPLDRSAAAHVMELAEQLKNNIGLPEILELLKGTEITLSTWSSYGSSRDAVSGRVLSVEQIDVTTGRDDESALPDWRVSLMSDNKISNVWLSRVTALYVKDAFISLGLHKGLDAAAVGGVFRVVDVVVHLDRPDAHDILVSYVVECPAWKPTYRLVLGGKDDVLLQGWAVVDNVTGEAWDNISLSLTSGAPLAFRYNLHAPKFIDRPDLSAVADQKVAAAAVGETAYGSPAEEAAPPPAPSPEPAPEANFDKADGDYEEREVYEKKPSAPSERRRSSPKAKSRAKDGAMDDLGDEGEMTREVMSADIPKPAEVSMQSLQNSVQSMVKASSASGAVRYDMSLPISVPDRSSTLVSILNHKVKGEEVFLYKPGGSGQGYEQNPYRVVRFKNATGFMLEPGPISIYSGGSFVGEGIAETISADKQAVIPFAVDASILVTSEVRNVQEGTRLLKIFNRQMWVESFSRIKTTYKVKGGEAGGYRLFVRHTKAPYGYELKDMPKGTEDVGDAYLIPIDVKKNAKETVYTAVEQTPVTRTLSIWDEDAQTAVSLISADTKDLDKDMKAKLSKVLEVIAKISEIDINLSHLRQKQWEIDQRMNQTRENLKSLKYNKAAGTLKNKLAKTLEELAKEGEGVTKNIVALTDERSTLAVSVDQMIGEISFGN